MRIGYSYWGFLGDHKLDKDGNTISAPDGNATYGWSIVWEMQRRGHSVTLMQQDRDYPAYKRLGAENFAAFSQEKRFSAYEKMYHAPESFPELDVLLLEWRMPIPGRNCSWVDNSSGAVFFNRRSKLDAFGVQGADDWDQPDLLRQMELLRHYRETNTKIVIWDLDHKLTVADEIAWDPHAIFETSHSPLELRKKRTRVEPPIHVPDLLQHPTLPVDQARKLVYIGSRYERDDVITEWLIPVSNLYPNQVEFHGNWLKTIDECRKLWPNVSYNDRCTTKDFRRIYGTAGAVPLLAKKSYLETGFITPRPWEALMFGSIPIGLGTAKGIEQYTKHIAKTPADMVELAEMLSEVDVKTRDHVRRENVEMLEFMDAKHFVDKLEAV